MKKSNSSGKKKGKKSSELKLLSIKPCDSTFFGTGKPFDFGVNDFVESKNVPYPSVFFGAIFSAILGKNEKFRTQFFDCLPNINPEEILEIGQVYLYNKTSEDVYIKAPLDLFVNDKLDVEFGRFEKVNNMTSLSFDKILISPCNKNYKRAKNYYINLKNIFGAYRKKQTIAIDIKDENSIFKKSVKTGIGIDKTTRNVEYDKLYKVQLTEFVANDWSFIVEYRLKRDLDSEGKSKISNGYLRLGGEGKICKYTDITDNSNLVNKLIEEFNECKENIINSIEQNDKIDNVKIILTSDSYYTENLIDLGVLGLANDKPIYIGGYSMANNSKDRQGIKKMYKGYSAGTILLMNRECFLDIKKNEKLNLNNSRGFNKYIVIEDK